MLTVTRRLSPEETAAFDLALITLSLTADERTRSRHRFTTDDGQPVLLQLPRGTVLADGDILVSELTPAASNLAIRVLAKAEPVLSVTASTPLALLRGAYHLGNRHVPLEVAADYLRLMPDPVLADLLTQLGLQVEPAITPFHPEAGAYGNKAMST